MCVCVCVRVCDVRVCGSVCVCVLGISLSDDVDGVQGTAPPPLSDRDWVLQSGWRYEFQGEFFFF